MDINSLNREVENYNKQFSSFQLDKKLMIMKAATLKEECNNTILEIDKQIRQLEADKSDANTRIKELDDILSKL